MAEVTGDVTWENSVWARFVANLFELAFVQECFCKKVFADGFLQKLLYMTSYVANWLKIL